MVRFTHQEWRVIPSCDHPGICLVLGRTRVSALKSTHTLVCPYRTNASLLLPMNATRHETHPTDFCALENHSPDLKYFSEGNHLL